MMQSLHCITFVDSPCLGGNISGSADSTKILVRGTKSNISSSSDSEGYDTLIGVDTPAGDDL